MALEFVSQAVIKAAEQGLPCAIETEGEMLFITERDGITIAEHWNVNNDEECNTYILKGGEWVLM